MNDREEQWSRLIAKSDWPAALFQPQEQAAQALLQVLSAPGAVAELIAPVGMGKSAILRRVGIHEAAPWHKPPTYRGGNLEAVWNTIVDGLAQRFTELPGHHLLIIDDADQFELEQLQYAISRIRTANPTVSIVISAQLGWGVGVEIRLARMDLTSFGNLVEDAVGARFSASEVEELWQASRGAVGTVAALRDRISPWQEPGLVAPDGKPLTSSDPRASKIIADARGVTDDMLRTLADDPSQMFQLSPRGFEELVAELFHRRGYEVTLTKQARDGGRDLHAVRHDELGTFLYLVEAKRWSPNRPVGVGVVRSLRGVAEVERATAALVVTTSHFTQPARDFASKVRYQLSLKDYFDLRAWLDAVRPK